MQKYNKSVDELSSSPKAGVSNNLLPHSTLLSDLASVKLDTQALLQIIGKCSKGLSLKSLLSDINNDDIHDMKLSQECR